MAAIVAGTAAVAGDDEGGGNSFSERLSGFAETPLALSTTGTGEFRALIDEGGQSISYTLSYSSLEGTVTQSHIHLGSPAQTGGVSVFLCTNLGNGPAGQGIAVGEFAELVRAIRAGSAYVNVHSTLFPVGEIRAQLDHHDH